MIWLFWMLFGWLWRLLGDLSEPANKGDYEKMSVWR